MYSDVVEVREESANTVNAFLAQGWKILEIKTITLKTYIRTVCIYSGWSNRRQPIYDETEKVIYVIGRPATA